MATTTNYGWTTPDDTALVKDGAAAIRTLGSSVDTTTKALNPSTTLGDIEYRSSTANTNTRLGIGTTGQVLTVSGGVPAWGTPAGGGMTLLSTTSLTGSTVTLSSIDQNYVSLVLFMSGVNVSANCNFSCKVNGTTQTIEQGGTENSSVYYESAATSIFLRGTTDEMKSGNADSVFFLQIDNYKSTTFNKTFYGHSRFLHPSGSIRMLNYAGSLLMPSTAISSLEFVLNASATFSAGSILLYGVK